MWSEQIQALDPFYRTIAYDQRGHGKSPASAHPYLFESFVDDLFGLLDHLRLNKAVLCGLSMGGYVALRAAEREPDRIHALVLCDTKSEADSDSVRLNRAKDLAFIQREGLPAFAQSFARRTLAPATANSNPVLLQRVVQMISGNPVAGVESALVALATRTDTSESLARIQVPTLILVGEHDTITPPAAAQQLRSQISSAKLVLLPNSGHLSTLEQREQFHAELLLFLKSLPTP